jgi:hypothetical protein
MSGIEERARQICYAENSSCRDNICLGDCRAVCPSDAHLQQASRQVFYEHWIKQGHTPISLRSPVTLTEVVDKLKAWWVDLRTPKHGKYIQERDT